jgi:hypothetical protein
MVDLGRTLGKKEPPKVSTRLAAWTVALEAMEASVKTPIAMAKMAVALALSLRRIVFTSSSPTSAF